MEKIDRREESEKGEERWKFELIRGPRRRGKTKAALFGNSAPGPRSIIISRNRTSSKSITRSFLLLASTFYHRNAFDVRIDSPAGASCVNR